VAEFPQPALRIGDALVASGLISEEQLQAAISVQRRTPGKRLGEVLVSLGYLSDADLAQATARQANLEFRYGNFPVDPKIARMLSADQIQRWRALPIGDEHGRIVVAFVESCDLLAMDDVRLALGRDIKPVIVTQRDFERALDRAHGVQATSPTRSAVEADIETAVRQVAAAATQPLAATNASAVLRPSETQSAARLVAVSEGHVVKLLDDLLSRAVRDRASDLHVEPQEKDVRVRMRVDGALAEVQRIELAILAPLISRIKVLADLDIAEHRMPQDGRTEVRIGGHTVDARISILPTIHGEKAVLRLLIKSQQLQSLDDVGIKGATLQRVLAMLAHPYGMVLVAGPTGSGKTTMLMAALSLLNEPDRNIVTVEDPVEYQIPGINQVQVNTRAGVDFAQGLRAILRQDPDVVMVGEIRDRETAEIAVRSALTGHLVLSSIHTNSAAATPNRLLDMGIEPYLVASSLVASSRSAWCAGSASAATSTRRSATRTASSSRRSGAARRSGSRGATPTATRSDTRDALASSRRCRSAAPFVTSSRRTRVQTSSPALPSPKACRPSSKHVRAGLTSLAEVRRVTQSEVD
jgi:type IV pilus assembly protein PilB